MSKTARLYGMALLVGTAFILTGLSGLLLLGEAGGLLEELPAGLSRREWKDLHIWLGLVMAAGVLIHLALHWNWLVRMSRRLGSCPRSSRVRFFYALDAAMGAAFLFSVLTGLPFLFLGAAGYQGGRNPGFWTAFLGLSRGAWNDLHTWFSLVLMAAALVHIGLHLNWLAQTTGRLFRTVRRARPVLQRVRE